MGKGHTELTVILKLYIVDALLNFRSQVDRCQATLGPTLLANAKL
jgi:hypothetical protein